VQANRNIQSWNENGQIDEDGARELLRTLADAYDKIDVAYGNFH
jgi:hypothetical protein